MPSFDRFHERLNASVNAVNGEKADIIPKRRGQWSGTADNTRTQKEITVVVSINPSADKIAGNRFQVSDYSGGSRISVEPSEIWVAADQLAIWGQDLKQGDVLCLKTRDGEPLYTISNEPKPNHLGDVRLIITKGDAA